MVLNYHLINKVMIKFKIKNFISIMIIYIQIYKLKYFKNKIILYNLMMMI